MLNFNELLPVEEQYNAFMEETVEPYLASRRTDGYVHTRNGIALHYEYTVKEDAIGAVVISHGFTESGEKFREMLRCSQQPDYRR